MNRKLQLLKTGSERSHELIELTREINSNEDTIAALREGTIAAANGWMTEVVLQGQRLIKAKAMLPHGHWMNWIKVHCPLISHRTANGYMLVATNSQRVANLEGVTSLRAALALCSEEKSAHAAEPSREWPAYLQALGRFSKLTAYVAKHPITEWPEEGLEKLRGDLQPLAAQLWPERFQG